MQNEMVLGDNAAAPVLNTPWYKNACQEVGRFCSKVFNSHAFNSPIKSWVVAITACSANILMSTPYPGLTAGITSLVIVLSGYADFRQICLKNRLIADHESVYPYLNHSKLINTGVGVLAFGSLIAYFVFAAASGGSSTQSRTASEFLSAISSILSNSSFDSQTVSTVVEFIKEIFTTPANYMVLIASFATPIHRMAHNHYVRKEQELRHGHLPSIEDNVVNSDEDSEATQLDVMQPNQAHHHNNKGKQTTSQLAEAEIEQHPSYIQIAKELVQARRRITSLETEQDQATEVVQWAMADKQSFGGSPEERVEIEKSPLYALIKGTHQEQIDDLEIEHKKAIADLIEKHTTEITNLTQEREKAIEATQQAGKEVEQLQNKIRSLNKQITYLQNSHKEQTKTIDDLTKLRVLALKELSTVRTESKQQQHEIQQLNKQLVGVISPNPRNFPIKSSKQIRP